MHVIKEIMHEHGTFIDEVIQNLTILTQTLWRVKKVSQNHPT